MGIYLRKNNKKWSIRGLGLALVEDFLNVSNGEMKILCNDTQLDIKGNNKKYSFMPVAFSGTIIEINMRPSEHGLYGFKNEFEGVHSSWQILF